MPDDSPVGSLRQFSKDAIDHVALDTRNVIGDYIVTNIVIDA